MRHRALEDAAVWGLASALALLAFRRIARQSGELLAGTAHAAAFDLRLRYEETHRWFAGSPVYDQMAGADYPPASYGLLWPLIGWLGWPAARALWLACSLAALATLSVIAFRAVKGRSGTRVLAAILPWAAYGTAWTIGVGQLGLVSLAAGLGGTLLARRTGRKALAGLLFALSLVKPTLTAPFFWLLLATSPVSGFVAVVAYGVVTLAASAFQPGPLTQVLTGWIDNGHLHVARGYGNVADWASALGHPGWGLPLAFAMLAALGVWVLRHRHTDVWILLGVSAFVARFFTYHYHPDDLLMIVPMIALLRLASDESIPSGVRRASAAVFTLAAFAQLVPTRYFTDFGARVAGAAEGLQVAVWLAAVSVLVWAAGRVPATLLRSPDDSGNVGRLFPVP
ncbi:MAG TPA: glycosyltransferase family 87 protein [Thermoanaerobaculia bacterium]|nr:glycosyltransferase family 87 protein [Thermoanaerobaculia bacterium]